MQIGRDDRAHTRGVISFFAVMMLETLQPLGKRKSNGICYFYGTWIVGGLERPMESHCRMNQRGTHLDWQPQPQSSVQVCVHVSSPPPTSIMLSHTFPHLAVCPDMCVTMRDRGQGLWSAGEDVQHEGETPSAEDGSVLVIPKGMKTDILDTLADSMSKISPYPERQHYGNVAKALVEKHPSLKEPGSGKGWYGWFHSLKFKLGNYRQKLSAAGCPQVRVNKRKGEEAKGPRMKKSKKGEVHYCPDPPEGLSDEDMEEKRMMMEVREEFKRVVSIDLLESFLDGLDDLAPRLLEVYEAATESAKKLALKAILDCLKKDDTNERRRIAALLGLPHYLREEPSDIIRMCDAHGETLAAAMEGMQLGLLIGYEGDNQDAFPREVFNVAVVVEETVVLHNFKDVPSSFAMLLGIIYCVNLEYPRAMKYSFEFLQRVVMKIKPDQASARVHGIRNKLLRYNL
ncbi:hypothetical protein E1301_Tti023822 [Triplophysa tibetana]|uniref:Sterile alpha motif domain-containing protein 3 n=2 Tax=Triplophysa tibetana TaxID=1572043 RepID=A0A5A9MXD5_9TELE|nr:hypothetical protein E1301_Tti023822 [Triplophysa tibetana]